MTFLEWVRAVPTSDYSLIMLERLAPAAFEIGASDILALGDAMRVLNSGLLLLASLTVGWHMLQGLVSTAHEGKVLGSRWHQIWAPARVVGGIGLLAPLPSGFCLAQVLVLQVAVWGVGMADQVWTRYSDSVASGKVVAYNSIPSSYDSMREIWLLEVCRASARETAWAAGGYTLEDTQVRGFFTGLFGAGSTTPPVAETPTRTVRNLGQVRQYRWDYGPFCGAVTFDMTSSGASLMQDRDLAGVILTHAGGARVDIEPARRALEAVKVRAVETAMAALRPRAERFVNPEVSILDRPNALTMRGVIEPVRTGYDRTVYESVATAADAIDGEARDAFRADARATGWASAATYYLSISRMSKDILEEVNRRPGATFAELKNEDEYDASHPAVAAAIKAMEEADSLWRASVPHHHQISGQAMTVAGEKGIIDDALSALVLGGDAPGGGALSAFDMSGSDDPMASMIGAGHGLLSTLWIGLGLLIGAGIVAGIGGALVSALAGGGVLTTIVLGAFFALFSVGAFYAYVLPLMPFSLYYFGVLGWLLFVAEALVAAPVWAMFHARMDGQDLVGDMQRPGYLLLFNLLMRPVLMLMGLLLGFSIFNIAANFLAKTIFPYAESLGGDSAVGVTGFVVLSVAIAYLHYQTAIRSFSLIHQIPDRVSRWFGSAGESRGEGQDAEKTTSMVGGVVTQAGGQAQHAAHGLKPKTPGASKIKGDE